MSRASRTLFAASLLVVLAGCSKSEKAQSSAAACDPTFPAAESAGVFVDSANGSDATGTGSRTSPLASIASGVARAITAGVPNVYVAPGGYPETLALVDAPAGISIQGGWIVSAGGWTRDCAASARASTVLRGGTVAVTVTNVVHRSGIQGMTIRTAAPPVSPAADSDGVSLIGVLIRGDGSNFFLDDVEVVAGTAGAAGSASAGAAGSACLDGGLTCGTGDAGATSAAGSPASHAGVFGPDGFSPAAGHAGIAGSAGHPGTTGGAGACADVYSCSAGCGFCNQAQTGTVCGVQGACGCGGAGGSGGNPGRGGGASAAVVVVGASAGLTVTGSTLQSGDGGNGAAGASGGAGVTGGIGSVGADAFATSAMPCAAVGGCNCIPVFGCRATSLACAQSVAVGTGGGAGGPGGAGGQGSAGGGGAGGPSHALVTAGGATATLDAATTLAHGVGGAGAGGAPSGSTGPQLQAP